MQQNEESITIIDHKKGFSHRVWCSLLNPSKTNLGKISKVLLKKINSVVLSAPKQTSGKIHLPLLHGLRKSHTNKLHHFYVLMWKIYIHLSPVIYSNNRLNLQDSSSRFLIMIYQSLCRPEKPFFLKVHHHGFERLEMSISTFQWVVSRRLKYAN